MKCPKCGGTIYSDNFCPRCGNLAMSAPTNIPGIQNPQAVFAQPTASTGDTYEEKVKKRKLFRKAYRIPLLAAVFYFIMDLYQNSAPDADHYVANPWPFIFQTSRIIALVAFILTLIIRSRAPKLFLIWSITVALGVRFFAVIYQYGVDKVTLTEWIWGVIGLTVVASFWILKYGVHHRVKNW